MHGGTLDNNCITIPPTPPSPRRTRSRPHPDVLTRDRHSDTNLQPRNQRASDATTASLAYPPAPASTGPAAGVAAFAKHGTPVDGGGGDDLQAGWLKRHEPGAVGELLARVVVVLEFVHEEVSAGGQGQGGCCLWRVFLGVRQRLQRVQGP